MTNDPPAITFSDEETRAQEPTEHTIEAACTLFRATGMLRLHRAIPLSILDELDAHYRERYSSELGSTTKEDRRPLFTVDVEGPFNRPTFYANPLFFPILQRLLGKDCILGACSSVVSFPGAPPQFTHRDSPSLFGDYAFDAPLPPYSLTVLMPLVDANAQTGSTEGWTKTHRESVLEKALAGTPVPLPVPRGSVMMTDGRVVHRGAENRSSRVRPLLYNSYHRHWFRDYSGYEHRPPLAISALEFSKVPEEYRQLFSWRFERYWKMRLKRRAHRVVQDVVPDRVLTPLKRVWDRVRGS